MTDLPTYHKGSRFRFAEWAQALGRHWYWVLLIVTGFAGIGFVSGYSAGFYSATVELLDRALARSPGPSHDQELPRHPSSENLVAGLARSDFVLRHVAEGLGAGVAPASLAAMTEVSVNPSAGLIAIQVQGRRAQQVLRLANALGHEVSTAARQWLAEQHALARERLSRALASVDGELGQASQQLIAFQQRTVGMDFEGEWAAPIRLLAELNRKGSEMREQLAGYDQQVLSLTTELFRLSPALVTAKDALNNALLRYTEEHPTVKELRATVASLEQQSARQTSREDPGIGMMNNPAALSLFTRLTELRSHRASLAQSLEALATQTRQIQTQVTNLPQDQADYVRLKSRFDALKEQRFVLARQSQETHLQESADAGRIQLVAPASWPGLSRTHKWQLGLWMAGGAALVGFLIAAPLVVLVLAGRGRIRSQQELWWASRLPLLATLDDLSTLTEEQRTQWGFRTFNRLRRQLTQSNQEAVICGFTSAGPAEGRSTCIRLLGDAAGRLGYRVVSISALSSPETQPLMSETEPSPAPVSTPGMEMSAKESAPATPALRQEEITTLPATWAWSPDYREQWDGAVQEWQAVKRLAVFVELPPASCPETVLLGEGLPNLVWLCHQDAAGVSETRLQLDTLRQARTNLVGCVFNRASSRRRKSRFSLMNLLGGFLFLVSSATAQETNQPAVSATPPPALAPANSLSGLTVAAPDRLANWQKRLTLGPGDVFDLSLYTQPDSARTGVSIGPDGRINYLEARDVMAAGLTIDELRSRLEDILVKFHRAPRVVINPVAYTSKKYYILGHVNQKGVFALDRPTSIIEAIAKAKGFVLTSQQRNSWVQADLSRSFLIRPSTNGTFNRIPVDFEKLFLQGDLGQNFSLEPDDYVFFPPLDLQEVYVLGEVRLPGAQPYSPDATALGAIIARGGFTSRAFKTRVLIVRGSLDHPQTFVLSATDILKGKGLDFPLRSRDIVYVHRKPWIKAQELLEAAVLDFIRAFAVAYAGEHIGPFISEPIVK